MEATTAPRTPTPAEQADIEFLMLCRSRLTPARRNELDLRIAKHANRIVDERGDALESAVTEATAQFGSELRDSIARHGSLRDAIRGEF